MNEKDQFLWKKKHAGNSFFKVIVRDPMFNFIIIS